MITLRCSRLPLALKCGPSSAPGLQVESADREAADMGSAVHSVLAYWMTTGRDAEGNPSLVLDAAALHNVDSDELMKQARIAWSLWLQVAGFYPGKLCEYPMWSSDLENGVTLTGHADILSSPEELNLPECRILDLKTGHADGDHEDQLRGYAYLASKNFADAEKVYAAVLRTREGSIDGRYYTVDELNAWYRGLVGRVKETTYRPGRHCGHCPRGATCEAKTALLKQLLELVMRRQLKGDGRESLAHLIESARIIKEVAEDALEMARAMVSEAGGSIPLDNGREIRLAATEQRKLTPGAFAVLAERIGDKAAASAIKVSKTEAEKAVKSLAPRGQKAKAWEGVMEALEAAGCVRVEMVERLEIRQQPKQIEATK